MRSGDTFRHKDHAMSQTDVVQWRWSPQGSEWKSNSKHGEAVETEAGIKGNSDADHEGDGETTRHR